MSDIEIYTLKEDYNSWYHRIISVLMVKKLWIAVNSPAPEDDPELGEWKKAQECAIGITRLAVHVNILLKLRKQQNFDTLLPLLDAIKDLASQSAENRRWEARSKLDTIRFKHEKDDIRQFIADLEELFQTLAQCNAGLDDYDKSRWLMRAILTTDDRRYEALRGIVNDRILINRYSDLKRLVISEVTRINDDLIDFPQVPQRRGQFNGQRRSQKSWRNHPVYRRNESGYQRYLGDTCPDECEFCGRFGHSEEQCRYKQNYEQRQLKKKSQGLFN